MGYFKTDGSYIYLDAEMLEMYIPKMYFDASGKFASYDGTTVRSLGVFNVGIFENGKLKEMKVMNLPSWIDFFVVDTDDRDVLLPGFDEPVPCMVLIYQKGHKIMPLTVVEDSSNVESYMNFILKGKVPLVAYSEALKIWLKNQSMNKCSLGVRPEILELILSVSYRYKKDPSIKFAHKISKNKNISEYDYEQNNIRQICQNTSTFTALTFEDQDMMITSSLNRSRRGGNEAYSPVEMLLRL